jgi:lipid-binding SYLF domain-containing protein
MYTIKQENNEQGDEPMKRLTALMIIMLCVLMLTSIPLEAASKQEKKVTDAINVIDEIMAIPEKGIPPSLLRNAKGLAIIPGVIKAGFIVGGRGGKGIIVVHDTDGTWSNPAFISFAGGSIGWQIGAQSADIILVFRTKRSVDNLMKGKFTLGADASVAAGPVGRQVEAGTDIELKAEIVSYSRTRGLFAGLSVEGSSLQIDDEANWAFYNRGGISTQDILENKNIQVPSVAKRLQEVLLKYSSQSAQ